MWSYYLAPSVWGQGVGDRLMHAGLAHLPQPVVRLWVLRDNLRAVRFYERHGFEIDEHSTYVHEGTDVTAPQLRMTLHRHAPG